MYEPADLEDMAARDAVDAVAADVREHRVRRDRHGLFTASRHIDLLCSLATRLAADAEHRLSADQPYDPSLPSPEALGQAAGHIGRAIAHYTQALSPLITLSQQPRSTLADQVDGIDETSTLYAHLAHARQALAEARASLSAPHEHGTPAAAPARGAAINLPVDRILAPLDRPGRRR
ncbi:hypothetical protein ACFWXK_20675 [Streptomyces sp. NPDC059070]|uniref:hypothetical protein n=1 Tax=Streptomyces sp. NPDC059070 TaxID=3346713 RepID=UPI0036BC8415